MCHIQDISITLLVAIVARKVREFSEDNDLVYYYLSGIIVRLHTHISPSNFTKEC